MIRPTGQKRGSMIVSIIALTIIFFAVVAADVVLAKKIKELKSDKEAVEAERRCLLKKKEEISADLNVKSAMPAYYGYIVPLTAEYSLNIIEADKMAEKMDLEAEIKKCLVEELKNGLSQHVIIFKDIDMVYCKYKWKAQVKILSNEGRKTEFGVFSPQ